MDNLHKIPFDQYQRYEICSRLINNLSEVEGKIYKILDVGGFFTRDNGDPWLPGVEFFKKHDVLVIDTVDVVTENYKKSDGRNLPFSDGEFDFVISNDVFEHIHSDDRERFLNELLRVGTRYVILNNPHYTAKTAAAEKLLYEYMVNTMNIEHKMLGEHISYGLPNVGSTEKLLKNKYKYKYYYSGDIDNWLYLMILRHELYGRGIDKSLVTLFDEYCNQFHFENEMNLVEGYRSTFIISLDASCDSLLANNFFEDLGKRTAQKVELPFGTIVNLFQLKEKNSQKSDVVYYFTNPKDVLPRMVQGSKILQTFSINTSNFHKIGFLVATYMENLEGVIKVTVKPIDSDRAIVVRELNLSNIEDNEWINIEFVPLSDSRGKEYILEIEQMSGKTGVSLYYSDEYKYGTLHYNGMEVAGGLCFKAYVRHLDRSDAYYEQKQLNDDLMEMNNNLKERYTELNSKRTVLELNVQELSDQIRNLEAVNDLIVDNNTLLIEKNSLLTEKNESLMENNKILNDLLENERVNNEREVQDGILREREKENHSNRLIEEIKKELILRDEIIKSKDYEISLVYSTKSWKLTKPLRSLTLRRRAIAKNLRLVNHLFVKNGGFFKGFYILGKKTAKAVKNEGFSGVTKRIKLNKAFVESTNIPHIVVDNNESISFSSDRVVGSYSLNRLLLTKREKNVDIVICVHNALEDVRRCIESIIINTKQPYSIIVVDDGSGEETKDYLEKLSETKLINVLRNDVAKGYTFAANKGLRESNADYVILLNSDTIVTPYWIEKMIHCADSDARIGLVGPLSNTASWQSVPEIEVNGDWSRNELPLNMSVDDMGELIEKNSTHSYPRISFLNGFCILIKRRVIEDVGFFDEDHFGRGYGEENDYCIRAQKNGWMLAIADDTYIYHAQSKSYSHEKRKVLVKHADEQLIKKHGQEIILQYVLQCQENRVLEGVRARVKATWEDYYLIQEGYSRWEGKRVAIVLPIIDASGGANVIFQESEALLEMGIDVRIINLDRHKDTFQKSYINNESKVPVIYASDESEIGELTSNFDIVIATSFNSVQWIEKSTAKKAYYIQDFEPFFFEKDSLNYKIAWESYTLIPDIVRVTKTRWNYLEVKKQIGVDSHIIGSSVNNNLFSPRNRQLGVWPERPLRIAAMIRPSTPRRNPAFTMEVLKEVTLIHGAKIECVLFGCESDDPNFQSLVTDFNWNNYGTLTSEQLAWLLNEVDIFVDFSTFQAMGLTAMEAMASGAAVIVPENGGTVSFVKNMVNGIVVDTTSKEKSIKALNTLINDVSLRKAIQKQAICDINGFTSTKAAFNLMQAIES